MVLSSCISVSSFLSRFVYASLPSKVRMTQANGFRRFSHLQLKHLVIHISTADQLHHELVTLIRVLDVIILKLVELESIRRAV